MLHTKKVTNSKLTLSLLWLVLAISSIVFIEPAPYDALAIGVLVVLLVLGLRVPVGIGLPALMLGLYVLANVIAGIASDYPDLTVRPISIRVFLVMTWLLFTCVVYEHPKRALEMIWKGYIFAAAVAIAFAFIGYANIIPIVTQYAVEPHGRVSSTFKDPNVFGPFLVPVAVYMISRLEQASGYKLFLILLLFLIVLAGIFLSFSRGAWLDLALATIVYMSLRLVTVKSARRKIRLVALVAVLIATGTLVIAWTVSSTTVGDLFFVRAKVVQDYDVHADRGRLTLQREALKEALARPLGVGPSQSERILGKPPHNLYIHVLIETGWLGAFAFWGFLAVTLGVGLSFCLQRTEIQRDYIVLYASLIGLLTQSLFIDSTHWRHLFLLLGMLWGPMLAWRTQVKATRARLRSDTAFSSRMLPL